MAVPAYQKSWKQLLNAGVPGVSIPFVSLLDTMQNVAFKLKDFLISSSGATTKWTLKWSASAGTGPTSSADTTDRITTPGAFAPRATVAAASQGWYLLESPQLRPSWLPTHTYVVGDIVVNSGNIYYCTVGGISAGSGGPLVASGTTTDNTVTWLQVMAGTGKVQLLVTYQGASDNICRFSFSPSAAFTLAGTTNQQPTATDEQVFWSTSVIGATASGNRALHLWVADDGSEWRLTMFRAGAIDNDSCAIGLGTFQDAVVYPCVTPLNVASVSIGGSSVMSNVIATYTLNTRGGLCRLYSSGAVYSCQVEYDTRSIATTCNGQMSLVATTQGGGFQPFPVYYSTVNNSPACIGPIGSPYDMYTCSPAGFLAGDGLNAYQWIQIGALIWPNPSGVAPTIT